MTTESKKAAATGRSRASRRGKTLTNTEKAEAIALWKAGAVTLDQLAERFQRDRMTFLRLFNKEGVTKGESREEHQKRVAEAVESAAVGDAAVIANRIRETKEQHYKMAHGIAAATYKLLAKCAQENRAVSTVAADLKAYKTAMDTLKAAREERYAVLGLNEEKQNDDTPLPDLVVQELTADQIKQMHKAAQESDDLGGLSDGDTLGELV